MLQFFAFMGGDGSIGKLLLATFLGGIIGWERERRGRPAGLRTHILVCVGVTLMMIVSEHIFEKYRAFDNESIIRVDPARIAAQVVTGVGFLGAGTIMRFRATVMGLTTAASLWLVAGVGLAVGSNCFLPAVFTTFLAVFALLLLPLFELEIKRDKYKTLHLSLSGFDSPFSSIEEILKRNSMELTQYDFEKDVVNNEIRYDVGVKFKEETSVSKVTDEIIQSCVKIRKLGWD
ncbi:MAG: MgtC/SapB family protein [Candidatus Brocadiaceae bacterium]|nr:MgtC/SapB family protein [Candidatus Brocadiaceae bacterium]